jgi:ABC-2 type transport system permease protein
MSALELAIYPSVQETLDKTLDSYPDAIKEAFRIETFDTPAHFLNGEMFSLIVPLAVAFFAIRAATRPLAGAEERHWLDTVLSAPVTRRSLAAGAFITSAVGSLAILGVLGVFVWVSGLIAGAEVPLGDVIAGCVGVWPLALFAAGAALLIGGLVRSWAALTGTTAGLLVVMYVLDVVARVADSVSFLGHVSVFHGYGSALTSGLPVVWCLVVTGIALVLAVAGTALFERRDVRG